MDVGPPRFLDRTAISGAYRLAGPGMKLCEIGVTVPSIRCCSLSPMFRGLSLCVFVGHNCVSYKSGWTDRCGVCCVDSDEPKEPFLGGRQDPLPCRKENIWGKRTVLVSE